jgi:flagella basal body P-ring formation protein FlgA
MTHREIVETRQSILFMCLLTIKSIIIAMTIGFGLLYIILSVGISTADAATLKSTATVNDNYIRLGDIFDDSGKGDLILGNAPQPGSDMVINARTLNRLALTNNIDWRSSSVTDQIIIRREAHTVSNDDIQNAVKAALDKRGVSGQYTVSLSNLSAAMVIPRNIPATAEVSTLSYTPGRDMFTATVAVPSADNPVRTLNVSGMIERTTQIPVLKSALRNGDIIGSGDIEWIDVSIRTLAPDAIIDADKLLGKTPVRLISTNAPIRIKDVTNPQLVSRGDEITILVMSGGMQLTAKGKAMQNGSEGDVIRAVNVASNRSITAVVTGDRTVTVQ